MGVFHEDDIPEPPDGPSMYSYHEDPNRRFIQAMKKEPFMKDTSCHHVFFKGHDSNSSHHCSLPLQMWGPLQSGDCMMGSRSEEYMNCT